MWQKIFLIIFSLGIYFNPPIIFASSVEKEILFSLGYQFAKVEGSRANGPESIAQAQFRLLKVVDGPTLIAGVGSSYQMLRYSIGDIGVKMNATSLYTTIGIDFLAYANVSVQALLGYQFGLLGDMEWEGRGVKAKKKMNSLRCSHHELRAFYPINAKLDGGLGISWFNGEIRAKDLPDELLVTGNILQLLLKYRI